MGVNGFKVKDTLNISTVCQWVRISNNSRYLDLSDHMRSVRPVTTIDDMTRQKVNELLSEA
jgi:hypothetical protein